MPPCLTITPLQEGDLAELVGLDGENPSPWALSHFQQLLSRPHDFCFVGRLAGSGQQLAGFICGQQLAGEAEIHKVAVAQELRRQGVGRQLLQHTLAQLTAPGIYLELRASNLPARNLYESLGFCCCGQRKKYYSSPTEDAIIMKLQRC